MKYPLLAILASLLACTTTLAQYINGPIDCKHFQYNHKQHDISKYLDHEHHVKIPRTTTGLRFNLCAPLKHARSDAEYCPSGSRMCLYDSGQPVAHMGSVIGWAQVDGDKGQVVFGVVGGAVSADGFPFVGVVRVLCQPDARQSKVNSAEGHSPFYQVTVESPEICNLFESLEGVIGHGSFRPTHLIKWIIFLLLLYVLVGSVYRAVALGKRGSEIVPNHQFFANFLTIMRDFFVNLHNRLTGRPGYQML